MEPETILAIVAFIVSLIALLVALTQLTADLFATAEGRRKTSPSVMGPFGYLTDPKRRPLELRYEVFFVSPELRFARSDDVQEYIRYSREGDEVVKKDSSLRYGYPYGILERKLKRYLDRGSIQEVKGWQGLLEQLRSEADLASDGQKEHTAGGDGRQAHLILHQRSWDSLPDGIHGPIASTRLSDIILIGRRLGMRWISREARGDGMRAEGGQHMLISSDIPGLGLGLAYYYSGRSQRPSSLVKGSINYQISQELKQKQQITDHLTVSPINWTRQAEAFVFGICLGNKDFQLPNFILNTEEDFVYPPNDEEEFIVIWSDPAWSETISKKNEKNEKVMLEILDDIVALSCPMMRQMGDPRAVLPFGRRFSSLLISSGRDSDYKDRDTFLKRLKKLIHNGKVKDPSRLEHLRKLKSAAESINRKRPQDNAHHDEEIQFLNNAQQAYQLTTDYFKPLIPHQQSANNGSSSSFYLDLMRAYTSKSAWIYHEAAKRDEKGECREPQLHLRGRRRHSERVHLFFDSMHTYAEVMAESQSVEEEQHTDGNNEDDNFTELVTVAMVTLFFRGLCWGLCHVADRFDRPLPVKFYESEMPVFLL